MSSSKKRILRHWKWALPIVFTLVGGLLGFVWQASAAYSDMEHLSERLASDSTNQAQMVQRLDSICGLLGQHLHWDSTRILLRAKDDSLRREDFKEMGRRMTALEER